MNEKEECLPITIIRYNSSDLEIEIAKKPVNPEQIRNLALSKRVEFVFYENKNPESKGLYMPGVRDAAGVCQNHIVFTNSLQPTKEQKTTLIHELIHIFYGAIDTCLHSEEDIKVEQIIERETQKFIDLYSGDIDRVYLAIRGRSDNRYYI